MLTSTLFRAAYVVTMDPHVGDLDGADVLVEDGKIVQIGYDIDSSRGSIVDASGMILMPGMIDTHRHCHRALLQGMAGDLRVAEFVRRLANPVGLLIDPGELYISTLVSAVSALDAGITTILDWSNPQNSPDHTAEALRALDDAGVRAVFGFALGSPANDLDPRETPPRFAQVRRLREGRFNGARGNDLVSLALAPSGPGSGTGSADMQTVRREWKLADELDLPISTHATTGDQPLQRLAAAGLLRPRANYVHGCNLSVAELHMIADTGGTLSVTPTAELMLGIGWPAAERARAAGVRYALGSDLECVAGGSMLDEVRLAVQCSRFAPTAAVDAPIGLTCRQGLELVTHAAAQAVWLDGLVGSISVGMFADLVLIDPGVNLWPRGNPVDALMVAGGRSNIHSVYVGGEPKKLNGRLVGLDLAAIRARAQAVAASWSRLL